VKTTTDLFTLENVTDHLRRFGDCRANGLAVLPSLRYPSSGHENDQVSNVCDVRYGPQGVIHHDFLIKGTEKKKSS
jgi:hypothetical protein